MLKAHLYMFPKVSVSPLSILIPWFVVFPFSFPLLKPNLENVGFWVIGRGWLGCLRGEFCNRIEVLCEWMKCLGCILRLCLRPPECDFRSRGLEAKHMRLSLRRENWRFSSRRLEEKPGVCEACPKRSRSKI